MTDYSPIIGVEVHVELTTLSKMFCGCPAYHFGAEPNTQTCPVCLGLPGALPVPNKGAIERTIMIGLALNCSISEKSHFDRKQYFYPDLAKGYQISQFDQPFCYDGYIELDSGKKVRIERVHLEEDTAKLQHTTLDGESVSLVDFNRSGVPLVEIVCQPDMNSAEEAKEYLKKIYQLIRALGVSDADMEKGQMRLEPTVNVKVGSKYTPLVELKNINSFNFAAAAIEYEVKRQVEEFKKTGVEKIGTNKTTRGYDSVKKVTFTQREKEEAKDYRYFPEPDIPPITISSERLADIRKQIPELPEQTIARLVGWGLRVDYAKLLVADEVLNSVSVELVKAALDQGMEVDKVVGDVVNGKVKVEGNSVAEIVRQVKQQSEKKFMDQDELKKVIDLVIEANEKAVNEYKGGKQNSIQYLLGQVMRTSQGMAKAEEALVVLQEVLS